MYDITISGGELSQKEIDTYIYIAKNQYPEKTLIGMDIYMNGDFLYINYRFSRLTVI